METDSPTAQGYSSLLISRVNVVTESEEVQDRRETRSYFCELIAVIVKVSSKRSGSDMFATERSERDLTRNCYEGVRKEQIYQHSSCIDG